jgi:peptidoglycan hydrolase-like protein with peptidoglycan-binding domain
MIIREGDKGPHIVEIQKALKLNGCWPKGQGYSENFGPITDASVRKFQASKKLVVDGKVGRNTLRYLGITQINIIPESKNKWKGRIIQGSVFPDAPIVNYNIKLNKEMREEYLPELKKLNLTKGFELLITAMAYKEGFRKGTRAYRTNNPGNIGNTDSGSNRSASNLKEGILRQVSYINSIVDNRHKAFPLNKRINIRPYYSPEIARHEKLYGMSPYLPGYEFIFSGQLDQFAKIYATAARGGNSYVSTIISYLKQNGFHATPQTKIQDIIKMD